MTKARGIGYSLFSVFSLSETGAGLQDVERKCSAGKCMKIKVKSRLRFRKRGGEAERYPGVIRLITLSQ